MDGIERCGGGSGRSVEKVVGGGRVMGGSVVVIRLEGKLSEARSKVNS